MEYGEPFYVTSLSCAEEQPLLLEHQEIIDNTDTSSSSVASLDFATTEYCQNQPEKSSLGAQNKLCFSDLPETSDDSRSSGMYPRPESRMTPLLSKTLREHCNRKRGSGSSTKRLRTPRTLTRLMQQHRDNERHRHRGLNASIRELTKCIPGHAEALNDTKIGKLQRIINYICHLEVHIQSLCVQVGLDLEFKNLFLSPHITSKDEKKTGPSRTHSVNVVSSTVHCNPNSRKRRNYSLAANPSTMKNLKVSSPTIDSTTDPASHPTTKDTLIFPGENVSRDLMGSASSLYNSNQWRFEDAATLSMKTTPTKQSDWLSHTEAPEVFLSPETASFLRCTGYDAEIDSLDLSGTFEKICGGNSVQYQDCHTASDTDSAATCHKTEVKVETNVENDQYLEYASIQADSEIPPVLLETELSPIDFESAGTQLTRDKSYTEKNMECSAVTDTAEVPTYQAHSVDSESDSEGSEMIHLVPHLEGIEDSDEEGDMDDQVTCGRANPSKVHVEMLHHQPDPEDLLSSKLQNIEEDDTSYSEVYNEDNNSFRLSETSASQTSCGSPLFTLSGLLVNAGLSPQYLKVAKEGFGYSNSCMTPVDSPALESRKEFALVPQNDRPSTSSDTGNTSSSISDFLVPYNNMDSQCISTDSQGSQLNGNSPCMSEDDSIVPHTEPEEDLHKVNRRCVPIRACKLQNQRKAHEKIHHRKTSWMNGFMMFSHMNRQKYIEKNPHIPTSHISKVLGQAWRQLSTEQKQLYKDKALQYSG